MFELMPKHGWKSLLLLGLIPVIAGQEDNVSIEHSASSERFSQCSQADYYKSVNVEDRDQLEALVTSTHRRRLPYTSSDGADDVWLAMRELYPGESSDTVRLIYSQTDMAVSLQGELDGWNREHLWPLSYGVGNAGADYTDVHSIAPSDWNVNAIRSNKYFGTCDKPSSDDSTCVQPAHANAAFDTETNAQLFLPPASVQGDIARALMYMDVRYSGDQEEETDLFLTNCPGESDNSMGILSQLLQWHVDDPVSEEEQTRNANICTCWQGNRNPFIDYPELADIYFGSFRDVECENGVHDVVVTSNEAGHNTGVEMVDAGQDSDSVAVDGSMNKTDSDGGDTDGAIDLQESEVDSGVGVSDGSQGSEGSGNTTLNNDETSNVTDITEGGVRTNETNTDSGESSNNETFTYGGEEIDVDDSEQRPFVLDNSLLCPSPGSIMIVGFNSDYPDTLALVALERISQGTTIYITDNGWTGSEFRDTEGYLKLEVPTEGIAAGAVFGYSQNKSDEGEFSENNWESVRGNFDLSQSGDTMLVVCKDKVGGLTFLTGLTFGGRWYNAGGDTTYSALPETLEQVNNSYVTLSHYDSYRYVGPTSGTAYRLREAIANPNNWEASNDERFEDLAAIVFDVAPPIPGEGGEGEDEESRVPNSDPQTDSLGTLSSAPRCCWNILVGVVSLFGVQAVF